jgi:hypothetical protein
MVVRLQERIDGEQRAAREQLARSINDELDGVRAEAQGCVMSFIGLRPSKRPSLSSAILMRR